MCDDIIGMEKYRVTQQIKVKRDSEAQIMREVCRDVQTEPTLLPINENDHREKSTLLTMQGWMSLREECGIAVRKLSLAYRSHILPHSHILGSPWQRSTNNTKKRRINTTKE